MAMHSDACLFAGQRCYTVIVMSGAQAFDPDSATPLYAQVADHVAGQIAAGALQRGQKLPAERDLADDWGVAYQTVRRAMRELRERGLIVSVVGKGTFVANS
jgi:DNA-binding GntR family transcriptional regulator